MKKSIIFLSLMLGAFSLAVSMTPVPSAAAPPQACVDLNTQIHNATALSTILSAGNATIDSATYPNGVYFDAGLPAQIGRITILAGATLYVPDTTVTVGVQAILVQGVFQAGTQACPIGTLNPANKVILDFTGTRPQTIDTTIEDCTVPDNFMKGIQVGTGGTLRLYGAKGIPLYDDNGNRIPSGISWTHLAKPAGPAFDPNHTMYDPPTKQVFDTAASEVKAPVSPADIKQPGVTSTPNDHLGIKLHLADNVTQGPVPWQSGDWIVVATTSFSPSETEFVQIDSIAADGKDITLKNGLRHYHFGGLDPGPPSGANYAADHTTNYGVDERAEVGLLSRNIKLTADVQNVQDHWGGEVKVCPNFTEASIQGVELEKFGKEKLGSYPLHFHMLGDVTGKTTVDANSIHHSYNHCMTVHSTSNMEIVDNVCARITGHIFYEEVGDEQNTLFQNNLGLGAMSNDFNITDLHLHQPPNPDLNYSFTKLWWDGDNLAKTTGFNFDGLNIKNTGNVALPVHGSCKKENTHPLVPFVRNGHTYMLPTNNALIGANPTAPDPVLGCTDSSPGTRYYEAASGFWIVNPTTRLIGNSIGGAQGMGVGFWWANPGGGPNKFTPLGTFYNNRAHACYYGFYDENSQGTLGSDQIFPRIQTTAGQRAVISTFDGITATRNRYLGFWMRPEWIAVKNGRFASNRESISLVTSGGLDGNAPGVWSMLTNSVLVGRSENNVDFFGPCPYTNQAGPFTGDQFACVDANSVAGSYENYENGYTQVYWNWAGFYIYDGPVRIFGDRFVNYKIKINSLLTAYDKAVLAEKVKHLDNNSGVHEGDSALGWFKGNQSAYPTSTVSEELSFTNVDLRHQIFTEKVNLGDFQDGDKNTVIIDRDGSLTGLTVVDQNNKLVAEEFPVSLNNLTFNASSNSLDECESEGQQDLALEGRPTSLMTPGNIASLEFEAQNGFTNILGQNHKQNIAFHMDSAQYHNSVPLDPDDRTMNLTGRDNKQVWEPKVASGYGYTIMAKKKTTPQGVWEAGIPAVIDVGLTDAVKPNMQTDPFYVRVGICYTDQTGNPPQNASFAIQRGYKSWGQFNGVSYKATTDQALRRTYTDLETLYNGETCHNLDTQTIFVPACPNPPGPPCPPPVYLNLDPVNGCPAHGVTVPNADGKCPDGLTPQPVTVPGGAPAQQNLCIYPKSTLTAAGSLTDLGAKDPVTGHPKMDKYFYDPTTGWLFFYVVQDHDNPVAPSPLGSCDGTNGGAVDASCPDAMRNETYYACPRQGCIDYKVTLSATNYVPGESKCNSLVPTSTPEVPPASKVNKLAAKNPVTNGPPLPISEQLVSVVKSGKTFYHRRATPNTHGSACPNYPLLPRP